MTDDRNTTAPIYNNAAIDYAGDRISDIVIELDEALARIIRRATTAQASLRGGKRVGGFMPVLGDSAARVEELATRLSTLIDMAGVVGMPQDELTKAYKIR
jgi:hypothetical protein